MNAAVITTLSQVRFATYLTAAGHNQQKAFDLYLWNAKLGAAFVTPIQTVEIALRNCIDQALRAEFGQSWFTNTRFIEIAGPLNSQIIANTLTSASRPSANQILSTDQIVARLSFGFWVGMLHDRFEHQLWRKWLNTSFPHLPTGTDRKSIAKIAKNTSRIRNRIFHHEPILAENNSQLFTDMMTLLSWICPTSKLWVQPHCQVQVVLRQKP